MAFQFNINRDELLKAISAQQNITSKKGTLAILSNVLLEIGHNQVTFTGTDLEIGLKQTVPAEVISEGALTLPAKKLFELARESASTVISFQEEENNWVEIQAGPSVYKLAGMIVDEFPLFPELNQDNMVVVNSDAMADLVDKTVFSIAQEKENMYSLNAAMFLKSREDDKLFLRMVSSDGHRLSIMSREVDEKIDDLYVPETTLIPRRGVQEIRKFCENRDSFYFGIEEKQAFFKSDNGLLVIRLMEGVFPDVNNIINAIGRENIIQINRIRFLESLKRINLFTEDLFHAIKMELKDEKMILTSQNSDYGSAKDEFSVKYEGKFLSLGFNCRYFIDTLQVIEGETIQASISSNDSPCLITSDDDPGFLSIIMPMKL
ncbi:MAG: DNA polymerase III subunit beta [Desulfobulbus propionicus]|nr:MAG: DNA polymerase III subunit beta [Desulfobulbus propionicus]